VAHFNLGWQSKLVLLLVLPWTAVSVVVQTQAWWNHAPASAIGVLGLSVLLGLLAWMLRTATPPAALTGAVITASLMFSTLEHTAIIPVLILLVLTSLATRFGRRHKERLGTAEKHHGRSAAQVAANLGIAALAMEPALVSRLIETPWFAMSSSIPLFTVGLAALAESAADTVSSEIGQVLGGQPRMITTLRRVDAGTDGGITFAGTAAGVIAAGIVAASGCLAFHGGLSALATSWAAGVFGLFFDSLLGATLERAGWLNNDGVNFLSTASAAGCALAMLAVAPNGSFQLLK
jgi:uncharacterized protein (TIGR00297 family)